MHKPRVAVLGAGGFIGSHMVKFLKDKGYWVRAVDIKWPDFRKELWSGADDELWHDLRDQEQTETALYGADWVFHFAADHGGAGYFHSDADYPAALNNMQIDLNVLKALQPNQRLFYSSSACAYPIELQDKPGHKLKETEIDHGPAERLYGSEKRQMLLFCNELPNARVGIFTTIYGPGAEYEGIRAKFPTAICKRIADAEKISPLNSKVDVWGDGKQERTFQFIDDALEKIYRVMTSEKYEGPVNIGSDEVVTVQQCVDYVAEAAGISPVYEYRKDKPTGVNARLPDNTKFNRLYGEVPQTPAKDGFIKTYEYIKNI